MHDLIRAVALRARLVFAPPPHSRHRSRPAHPVPLRAAARPAPAPVAPPRPGPVRLPAPRSPYGLDVPLDGAETAMVRPYLLACEQREERARQRQRRLALVLAADFGIDLDMHLVGAQGMA
jgi:hypothetical protein